MDFVAINSHTARFPWLHRIDGVLVFGILTKVWGYLVRDDKPDYNTRHEIRTVDEHPDLRVLARRVKVAILEKMGFWRR